METFVLRLTEDGCCGSDDDRPVNATVEHVASGRTSHVSGTGELISFLRAAGDGGPAIVVAERAECVLVPA